MEKKRLFFDCDGFLFNTIPAHIAYFKQKYSVLLSPEDFSNHPDLYELIKSKSDIRHFDISHNDFYKDMSENFLSSWQWHQDILPMKGMKEVIQKLAKKYDEIHIVTARDVTSKDIIRRLCDIHISDVKIHHIHCVWRRENNKLQCITKKEYLMEFSGLPHHYFFDDSLHEILKTTEIIPSFLYDPYHRYDNNIDVKGGTIQRIFTWQEILEI